MIFFCEYLFYSSNRVPNTISQCKENDYVLKRNNGSTPSLSKINVLEGHFIFDTRNQAMIKYLVFVDIPNIKIPQGCKQLIHHTTISSV